MLDLKYFHGRAIAGFAMKFCCSSALLACPMDVVAGDYGCGAAGFQKLIDFGCGAAGFIKLIETGYGAAGF